MTRQTSAKFQLSHDHISLNTISEGGAPDRESRPTGRQEDPSPAQMETLIDLCAGKQLIEALSAGTQLLEKYPGSALLYKLLGRINAVLDQSEAAVLCYTAAIAFKADDAEAYNSLGKLFSHRHETQRAATCFDKAIALDPEDVTGYVNMGDTLFQHRDFINALDYYMEALRKDPNHKAALYNLAQSLRTLTFTTYVPLAAEMFVRILNKTPLVRPEDLAPAAISLVKLDPDVRAAMACFNAGTLNENLEKTVSQLGEATLLLKLLSLCPLPDLALEELFREIRAALLFKAETLVSSPGLTKFCEALAIQAFVNEYVYDQTDAEKAEVSRLETSVADKLIRGVQPSHAEICILASYKRLCDYEWCNEMTPVGALAALFDCQVVEHQRQKDLRATIPILENISDDVSIDVRSQYEEHPYPRWRNCGVFFHPFTLADLPRILGLRIRNKNILNCQAPEILIAGSGTGRTAVESAINYKDSKILAVDLSLSSLAYAKQQAMSLGLGNIDFLQADLSDLGVLDRQFDFIESTGVLHHMADPMAGWKVLVDCLKPGGLMKIGLYSALARWHIVKIREDIQSSIAARDISQLVSLRSKMIGSEEDHNRMVTLGSDFFSTSSFRDLVFHVQEHRFTLPQIKAGLKELCLEFCGFEGVDITRKFKQDFGGDGDLFDLDMWQRFESDNPDSFGGMYQFWCQKKQV